MGKPQTIKQNELQRVSGYMKTSSGSGLLRNDKINKKLSFENAKQFYMQQAEVKPQVLEQFVSMMDISATATTQGGYKIANN